MHNAKLSVALEQGEDGTCVVLRFLEEATLEVAAELRYDNIARLNGVADGMTSASSLLIDAELVGFIGAVELNGLELSPEVDLADVELTVDDILDP